MHLSLPSPSGNVLQAKKEAAAKAAATSPSGKTADGRTIPIADASGHLLVKKKPAAFTPAPPLYARSPARWPEVRQLRAWARGLDCVWGG